MTFAQAPFWPISLLLVFGQRERLLRFSITRLMVRWITNFGLYRYGNSMRFAPACFGHHAFEKKKGSARATCFFARDASKEVWKNGKMKRNIEIENTCLLR